MGSFREPDRTAILDCRTDDVPWRIPGFFEASGKAEFEKHIVDEGFVGTPEMSVTRLTEEDDIVVSSSTL